MIRILERVTLATYGDLARGAIHIDVRELHVTRRPLEADTRANRLRTARCAIADLRAGGIAWLIVAHVNGMRGAGA